MERMRQMRFARRRDLLRIFGATADNHAPRPTLHQLHSCNNCLYNCYAN